MSRAPLNLVKNRHSDVESSVISLYGPLQGSKGTFISGDASRKQKTFIEMKITYIDYAYFM